MSKTYWHAFNTQLSRVLKIELVNTDSQLNFQNDVAEISVSQSVGCVLMMVGQMGKALNNIASHSEKFNFFSEIFVTF